MSTTAASDLLRADHRLVEMELDHLLHAVKHQGASLVGDVRRGLAAIQCLSELHFAKEEDVLYPYLRTQLPSFLAELDEQHEHAREVENHLAELIDSAADPPSRRQVEELANYSAELCDVIQHHIVSEEDQLLRFADARLSAEEQESLALKMKQGKPLFCLSEAERK
jgi:hemerythrin-like domain-containing protein